MSNCYASVIDPSDNSVTCNFEELEEGTFSGSFVPSVVGIHKVKICRTSDNAVLYEFEHDIEFDNVGGEASFSVSLGGKALPTQSDTGKPKKYRAVITDSNGDNIPCEFEELDDERCKIQFVPKCEGDHNIQILKLGTGKVIYEFTFPSEKKNVNQITTFTITIEAYKASLRATITSPSGKQVDCRIEEVEDQNWKITFTPEECGDHVVRLFQDDSDEAITEFIYTVVGKNTPLPSEGNFFRVGEPIKMAFNVDGRQVKPETDFSATVTSPSKEQVKCIFEELDDGTCKVRFIPTEKGTYVIKLFKKGKESPISEFTFDADAEHIDETASFIITIQTRKVKFSAIVLSPSNVQVDCTCEEVNEGNILIRFTPNEVGNYTIHIFEGNDKVPVATLTYKVVDEKYDVSRAPSGENVYRVGEPIHMTVDVAEEKQKLSVTVTSPTNSLVESTLEESDEGICIIRFTPDTPGEYIIKLFQGSNPIPVAQFTYTVKPQPVLSEANFSINVSETIISRKYSATVTSPSGEQIHCRVEETEDGSCRVRFIPNELGDYLVRVFQNDMEICQFTYKVNDLVNGESAPNGVSYGSNFNENVEGKQVFIQDQVFKIGEKVSFYLDDGKNRFSANVTSPRHELLECVVEERRPDEFVIQFTPKEFGDHLVKIYNNGQHVYQFIYKVRGFLDKPVEFKVTSFTSEPGRLAYKIMCPPKSKINYGESKDGGLYEINVNFKSAEEQKSLIPKNGAEKCTAEGTGLRCAKKGEVADFKVNANKAGRGSLMVGVEGPKQPSKEIIVKHIGDQVYSVNYTLDMEGNYTLTVMWGGEHIPGSPFHVSV